MDFWRFSLPSDGPAVPFVGQYDIELVFLSYLVSVLAWVSAMAVLTRVAASRSTRVRSGWLTIGSLAAGTGVWAMHFTAMVAFTLPTPMTYGVSLTAWSSVPAVLGAAAALYLISGAASGWGRIAVAGLCLAVGIGTMHYVGMEAMRVDAYMVYDPLLFALSILVAWVLAAAALTLHSRVFRNARDATWLNYAGVAALAGAAVCGMHYTAMSAAAFYPSPGLAGPSTGVSTFLLSGVIFGLAVVFGVLALVCVVFDIRLAHADASVAATAERHRAVLQSMARGLIIFDQDGTAETTNKAARELLGYEKAELSGAKVEGLFFYGEGDTPFRLEDLGQVADAPRSVQDLVSGIYGRRSDGTFFPLDLRASRARVGDEDLISLVFSDVTAQMESEATLRRLAAAVDQAPDGIFLLSAEGVIEYVNPAFERVSGYSPQDVLGSKPLRDTTTETGTESREAMWRAIEAGEDWSGVLESRRKDGTAYYSEASISPIRDRNGCLTSFVAVERDVTEQRQLESQLRSAQKLESVGQLAAGIAHEINTPTQYVGDNIRFLQEAFEDLLTAITRLDQIRVEARHGPPSETLLDEADKAVEVADVEYMLEEIPRAIEQSLEGVDRVSKIVRAMKEFSHPAQEKSSVDLNQAIQSTVTVATNEWKYVADMELDLDPDLPPVPCVPGEVNQVVLNMVVNASHAIADVVGDGANGKGTIRVSTRGDDGMVEIRISDTGSGIPEDVRAQIFDPFFTTKDVGKGTGQGLAIAHSVVVQKHGGALSFETEIGAGTTFIIRLPLDDSQAGASEEVA